MTPVLNHILSLLLCIPLAGAAVLLVLDRHRTVALRRVSTAFAAATLAASLPLWYLYDPHGKTWQFAERGPAIPAIGASYYVGVDGFAILLILVTTLVCASALVASRGEIAERVKEFCILVLVLEAGLLGAFMALDFLLFIVCSEVLVVAAARLLIRGWGSGNRAGAAARFTMFAAAGSAALIAGIVLLWSHTNAILGAPSLDISVLHTLALPATLQTWVFVAFAVAFAIRVPLVPFHAWLPDALAGAPTPVAVLVAALTLKIGTYGFVRFSLPILPDASREYGPWIAVLAASTLVYAGAMALRQREWTRLVSWTCVSQMGLVALGIFALSPAGLTGGVALQINHGVAFAAMFLAASAISSRQGREDDRVRHWIRKLRVPAVLFLIATLSATGAPLLGGFEGTRLIVRAALGLDAWWTAAAAAGVVLGACALLRLIRIIVWPPEGTPVPAAHRVVAFPELAAAVPLVVALIGSGVNPAALLTRVETAVGRAAARVTPALAPYVARGSDCATPAPPDPAGPPPVFVLAEPCADGSTAAPPSSNRPGRDR